MKFAIRTFLVFFVLFSLVFSHPIETAKAANSCTLTSSGAGAGNIFQVPGETISVSATNVIYNDLLVNADSQYQVVVSRGVPFIASVPIPPASLQNGTLSPIDVTSAALSIVPSDTLSSYPVQVQITRGAELICLNSISVQRVATNLGTHCEANSVQLVPDKATFDTKTSAQVSVNSSGTSGFNNAGTYRLFLEPLGANTGGTFIGGVGVTNGQLVLSDPDVFYGPFSAGQHQVVVTGNIGDNTRYCVFTNDSLTVIDDTDPAQQAQTAAFILCNQAAGNDQQACRDCVGGGGDLKDPNAQHYWTAFGCIQTSTEGIVTSLIRVGLGISGGFVLISILYGAFLLTTSSGEPKRVQEGQEMVTSAIMGLVFVIFSIIILRFIGVSILQIPGFGK